MNTDIITNKLLDDMDMSILQKDAFNDFNNHISDMSGKNHYRLLAYISTLFTGKKLLDIGTRWGWSALALSHNKNNTVFSYDLINSFPKTEAQLKENIEYRYGNFLNDVNLIKESPFIFLDVDPHDGVQEENIFKKLHEIEYKGIVMLDDIIHTTAFPGLIKFYNNIQQKKKDLTYIGHSSGTAIVYFE